MYCAGSVSAVKLEEKGLIFFSSRASDIIRGKKAHTDTDTHKIFGYNPF